MGYGSMKEKDAGNGKTAKGKTAKQENQGERRNKDRAHS
jgi:hypothetical protein